MKSNFFTKLNRKHRYINLFIKDLKDFYYDTRNMYSDPKITAALTYFRMNRKNESEDKIYKKINLENKKYHERYPHLINTSILILSFSFFESNLNDLSALCQDNSKNKEKDFSKFKVEISKFKNEIEYYSSINLIKLSKIWSEINFYREIRNCLIHYNGNINKMKNEKLEIKLKVHESISVKLNGDIHINNIDFILIVLNSIYLYLENILIELTKGKIQPLSLITEKELRIKEYEERLAHK